LSIVINAKRGMRRDEAALFLSNLSINNLYNILTNIENRLLL
jgi:hypothetical protein